MMKRLLSFFLGAALIVVLAVPVSAAELYDPWIDIAEVCTVNDSGSNYFAFNSSTSVTLEPGFSTIVSQIDMIWFCGYGAPKTVYLWRNKTESARVALNIEQIGGSYYRIYGNVGNYTLSEYKFDIDCGTGSGYRSYEIKSCRITESLATYSIDYTMDFYDGFLNETDISAGYVSAAPAVDVQNGITASYEWWIWPTNWKGYDYLDLAIATYGASISSIAVQHNGRNIPFEVTPIYTDSSSIVQGTVYDTPLQPSCYFIVHIDVSSISRTSSVNPEIHITGSWNTGVGADLQVQSFIGYINPPDRTGVAYWFERAKEFLTDLFGSDSSDALDDLGGSSDSITQDAADIHAFEQSQQAVLDNNFSVIQTAVTFTNFAAALTFVQRYSNMAFAGISDYSIVLTLPLFLGLFFYLCSRIPGVTRWKSPPPRSKGKGGGKP